MFTQINIVIFLVAFVVAVYFHFQSIKIFITHFGWTNYRLSHICVVGIPTLHHTAVPIIVTVATYYSSLEIYKKILMGLGVILGIKVLILYFLSYTVTIGSKKTNFARWVNHIF